MPIYQRFAQDDKALRRTIADALAVLRTVPDFTAQSQAEICVGPLRLPSGEVVGIVELRFIGSLPEVVYIVSLPTARYFRAVKPSLPQPTRYDITRLDAARVDRHGTVILADGSVLHAVKLIPADDAERNRLADYFERHRADRRTRSLLSRFAAGPAVQGSAPRAGLLQHLANS
jgi:hypothetical protein